MKQIADLHIHSKYSRACSKQLELENIDKYCRIKGVDIIATGDFTYPGWFSDIKNKLEEHKPGLFKIKGTDGKVSFILSTEVALIYTKGDKCRRIHHCVMAPSIKAAEKINENLGKIGNLKSDGRPILGLDTVDFCKICLEADKRCFLFPAHIWTPWFAIFGSKSGFDSLEECYGNMKNNIYAIETGLSSDPEMNWRVSELDQCAIISNSDAHSLPNIAREANIFDLNEISYDSLCEAIKSKNKKSFLKTIEFYPEEGMYHFDGHRNCGVKFEPYETKKHNGICPVCKKPLVVGVMNRVDKLADRAQGFKDEKFVPFIKLVELDKIIAESLNVKSRASAKVQTEYGRLIKNFGNELKILMDIELKEIESIAGGKITEGIRRVREGKVIVEGGFDGQYGKVKIFTEKESAEKPQAALF